MESCQQYAITISPDPKWVMSRKPVVFYRHVDLKRQYSKLSFEIVNSIKYIEERIPVKMKLYGVFELNTNGQMHFHGILTSTLEQAMLYQQWIYDEVGKMTFKDDALLKKICCNLQLLSENNKYRLDNGLTSWEQYLMKDQTKEWVLKYPHINVGNL